MNKIGCHVSMKAPDYFAGAVKEALSYKANALMIYTGPPQNTLRKPVEQLRIEEAQSLLKDSIRKRDRARALYHQSGQCSESGHL